MQIPVQQAYCVGCEWRIKAKLSIYPNTFWKAFVIPRKRRKKESIPFFYNIPHLPIHCTRQYLQFLDHQLLTHPFTSLQTFFFFKKNLCIMVTNQIQDFACILVWSTKSKQILELWPFLWTRDKNAPKQTVRCTSWNQALSPNSEGA